MAHDWRDVLSAWEEIRAEAEEYCELDDERVLVLIRLHGRGKASGLELGHLRSERANLFHVRGGKVTRLTVYSNRERALARPRPCAGGWLREVSAHV